MTRWLATLVVVLAACSTPVTAPPTVKPPAATGQPAATSAGGALDAFAASACADTSYANCVASVKVAAAFGLGSLVAICEYGDGTGDVVLIDKEADAEEQCSGGGLITPSRVVATVTIP